MSLGVLSSGARGRAVGAVATDSRFPWHARSDNTLRLQKDVNAVLRAAGYCPVPTSGVLDAATCRAVDFVSIRMYEFFGQEGWDLYVDSLQDRLRKPSSCRFDDPSDPPTAPVPGCFQPTGIEGLKKLTGAKAATETPTNWILVGGAASCILAAFVAFRYSRAKK